jgi:release factor glutamine methyltransferase
MTIGESLATATEKLRQKNIPSAHLDAEVLLAFVLKKPREFLLAHPEWRLQAAQAKKIQTLITKRVRYIPVAYLTGHKEFLGLDFSIDKNVLVPRPETELLVEEVAAWLRTWQKNNPAKEITVIDVGTGSGCIIITLKKIFPEINAIAVDMSPSALKVAAKNARQHKVRIKFAKNNLLNKFTPPAGNCIIVANLPYLDKKEKLTDWEKKSISREPKMALYGGKDGCQKYQKLFEQVARWPKSPLLVAGEINSSRRRPMEILARKYFSGWRVSFAKDLAGRWRNIIVTRNS